MQVRLTLQFYNRPTLQVAKNLLGKYVVRKYRGKNLVGKIVETEAYIGPHDKGAHTFGGKRTPRTEAMFLEGGHAYVYIVYGMYWMFNISTAGKEKPEAVLIRALEPISVQPHRASALNIEKIANGPGKLCNYLKINKSLYGEDLCTSKKLWLEDREVRIPKNKIIRTSRIGIDYAGAIWSQKPWRFYIKENPFVSKK